MRLGRDKRQPRILGRLASLCVVAAPAHTPNMAKPLRCTLRWHLWKRMTNDDNQVYRACSRCGKVDDDYFPPGNAVTF
jgi:hypothetical protein